MNRQIIPDVIDGRQVLSCFDPSERVSEAAAVMAERNIGAVLVMKDRRLHGIVTERDLVRRVLAQGLAPQDVTLGEVMTAQPDTILPGEPASEALIRMRRGNYRHLPVVDEAGVLHGMVSIRDLYAVVQEQLSADLIACETMIYGESYGTAGAV
ncbi:CBS domain-containing protein [Marinivivus vitaminiproducens]|uniref:CBS domain-containing protein n=1 Tax=Marinivivus vitaminiproducens TaxID=3035935 RepID=UPI0027A2C426|nr:CBS domain-containing protein [Geminicoccaceae bacterium SCSIO 64248]